MYLLLICEEINVILNKYLKYNIENMKKTIIPKKMKRMYFSEDFKIEKWQDIKKELEKLLNCPINSRNELMSFWKKVSELYKIKEDTCAWLYIRMTQYSNNLEHKKAFNFFIKNIEARSQPYIFELNKKFYSSPFRNKIGKKYGHLNKIISNQIELYREENIPLILKEQELAVKFREIVGNMTVFFKGEEKTIQQMLVYYENKDAKIREEAWRLVFNRYIKEKNKLNKLFDDLKNIRVQIAKNAGFKNYRDYMHQAKGRFSYSPSDLTNLHKVVKKVIIPFIEELDNERKNKLNLEILKPWDFKVNFEGEIPKAFETVEEMLEKSTKILFNVDNDFGEEFKKMQDNGFIDAENRKNKAPGGYCYPLLETGSSFIFMHSVGLINDVETIIHEAGHAMHNMMSKEETIIEYIFKPSEVAELASMSMELITLDYWREFYPDDILKIVKSNELKEKIKFIPWGIVVDAFQHWIYLNPKRTTKERDDYFGKLLDQYKIGGNWTGLEREKAIRWMMQLHIFQIPFYYIEYVLAQLGAIAIYRNYKKNPQKTTKQYKRFLKIAYTKPVDEVYRTAGIKFDFTEKYITELVNFIKAELKK